MARLQNKVVVITGAGSGMGRSSALLFASEGARLVLADIDRGAVERTAREVSDAGGIVIAQRSDVSREEDVRMLVERACAEHGRLDAIFNNAGIEGPSSRLADHTLEQWQQVLAVNLTGVFLGMKYAIPVMAAQESGGSIVNTASVAGLVGWHGAAAYSASKAAVVNLTRTAALEYAKYNVRVNCICPGVIQTAMVERITGSSPEALARLQGFQPLPRIGQPEDIARMALYLASDESGFVTGSAMVVDGGYLAR